MTGEAKIPAADKEKGLDAGATDFYLQGNLTKAYGKNVVFATVGYRKIANPPGFDLNDVLFLSVSRQRIQNENYNGGMIYD